MGKAVNVPRLAGCWFVGGLTILVVVIIAGRALWTTSKDIALVQAARRNDIPGVRAELARGTRVDAKWKGMTALGWAVYDGHADLVSLLLDRGANPTPALYQAVVTNRGDMVALLIRAGGNADWCSPEYARSPRGLATQLGKMDALAAMPREH